MFLKFPAAFVSPFGTMRCMVALMAKRQNGDDIGYGCKDLSTLFEDFDPVENYDLDCVF